ncbi:hypothetical protein EUA93_15495 [Nocardioides oleivorans]|uniref:Uncharacterized protein n=1 Tax=Nocardioides oleivorans TaxID=273676 RepID=A0A4Q2S5J3_9ACTN|nr:hypothetical protein [Nocardioides oleivorans]RYB95619.1 hypothetical protein EUA93_15495 [Nocardioides oleivorans]
MTPVFEMALRTGNWGPRASMLSFHASVSIELSPADRPGVLIRLVDGLPAVPRELTSDDVVQLSVCDAGGRARLTIRPGAGAVERVAGPIPAGAWELRIEGLAQRSLVLYARPGQPFPTDEDLDVLAATAQSASGVGIDTPHA